MIVPVTEENLGIAGAVHAVSWRESHGFCSPDFVIAHTAQRQTEYLRREMALGKQLFLLVEERPVGVVSLWGDLIENLYVLPEEQRRGFGARLLRFAEGLCTGRPTLWVLSNNERARRFYLKNGYHFSGREKVLDEGLKELEMTK